MRLEPLTKEIRVYFNQHEYETMLDCAPDRRCRLAMRLEAESSPRIGRVVKIRRNDFFVPDNPQVEIVFLKLRGTKDTTEGETDLGGEARLTWVPKSLFDAVETYCGHNNIADDEELFEIDAERMRQLYKEMRENAAIKTENEDYHNITSHDFRRYYATNMIHRKRVDKELVKEMGGWNSDKAIEPYLATPLPKEMQDQLARAGALEKDVSAPPRRKDLNGIYEELRSIRRLLAANEIEQIDGINDLSVEMIQELKERVLQENENETEETTRPSSLSEYTDSTSMTVPITTAWDWWMDRSNQLFARIESRWHSRFDTTPGDVVYQSWQTKLAFAVLILAPALAWLGVELAHAGLYIDPIAGDVSLAKKPLVGLMISIHLLHHEVADEWDELLSNISV